jgi:drug/metabolite transporter (DMT)-like permease
VTRRPRVGVGWLLFLTPVLWGATFPAAKVGVEGIGVLPFTFWTRTLGFLTIALALPWLARAEVTAAAVRRVALPGLFLGSLIFAAYLLQTYGLARTTATNAGFITGLYVVFVPLLGYAVFRRPVGMGMWVVVAVSVAGMVLLSVPGLDDIRPRFGDLLVLASAVAWAAHVVAIGHYAQRHSTLLLSGAQMFFTAVLHLITVIPVGLEPAGALDLWPMLAVTGVLGTGVAYTLQIVAQKEMTAARAVVILAGESVASAAFSFAFLGERLEIHQWGGAALVLLAMVASELRARRSDLQAEAAAPT